MITNSKKTSAGFPSKNNEYSCLITGIEIYASLAIIVQVLLYESISIINRAKLTPIFLRGKNIKMNNMTRDKVSKWQCHSGSLKGKQKLLLLLINQWGRKKWAEAFTLHFWIGQVCFDWHLVSPVWPALLHLQSLFFEARGQSIPTGGYKCSKLLIYANQPPPPLLRLPKKSSNKR